MNRLNSKKVFRWSGGLTLIAVLFCTLGATWSEFRGPNGNPVASDSKLPLKWGESTNVAWKKKILGKGPSSPIVVGNKVIVTSNSGPHLKQLHVLCYSADDGKLEWKRTFWATGRTLCHPSSTMAAPTPVSDGKFIYAFFASNDLACLDLEGNLKWFRGLSHDYPLAANDVGMSSSPVVAGKTVIVQIENQGASFAAGINTKTGETRWRVSRDRKANWTSPAVISGKTAAEDVVLLQSGIGLTAHNAQTGKKLWAHKKGCGLIASTTTVGDTIYVPSRGVTAIKVADGGQKKGEIRWQNSTFSPNSGGPVIHDGLIYVLNRTILHCGDAKTGKPKWRMRLASGQYWATPIIANNHLYIGSLKGEVQVIQLSKNKKGKLVSNNALGETLHGTPAVLGDAMFIRTNTHLWKISKK